MPDESMFDPSLPKDARIALAFLCDAVEEYASTGSDDGGDLDFFVKVAGQGIIEQQRRIVGDNRTAAIAYLHAAYAALEAAWPGDADTIQEMLRVTEATLAQLGRDE